MAGRPLRRARLNGTQKLFLIQRYATTPGTGFLRLVSAPSLAAAKRDNKADKAVKVPEGMRVFCVTVHTAEDPEPISFFAIATSGKTAVTTALREMGFPPNWPEVSVRPAWIGETQ